MEIIYRQYGFHCNPVNCNASPLTLEIIHFITSFALRTSTIKNKFAEVIYRQYGFHRNSVNCNASPLTLEIIHFITSIALRTSNIKTKITDVKLPLSLKNQSLYNNMFNPHFLTCNSRICMTANEAWISKAPPVFNHTNSGICADQTFYIGG
jgi:hypothetical protein